MRLTDPTADVLDRQVFARLSSRLETDVDRPIAVALSGGGDSVALLRLAASWARANGRALLALTVDHGLNPDSARWTAAAGAAARALGADWAALPWRDDRPAGTTGLPAAARMARHRLIAEAARRAGARVVLFAHTADDVAEGEYLRARGSTLGRLREWAPSPAWPEGRGLALFRPLLDVRREALRAWLRAAGAEWIEDPTNADPRFARSRARQALVGVAVDEVRFEPGAARGVLEVEDDLIRLSRRVDARALAAALVCAGGGDAPPRGGRLASVLQRLHAGEDFSATLVGARLEARGDAATVAREPGEFRRGPSVVRALVPGTETVWDGRWALTVAEPGWSARPATGLRAGLSRSDRAVLAALPPAVRGARPVLIRHGGEAPVLAGRLGEARALVGERLALALDGMTHEKELGAATHGAAPRNNLFSGADIIA